MPDERETAARVEGGTALLVGVISRRQQPARVRVGLASWCRPLGRDIRCHPIGSYYVYLRNDEAADTLFVVRVLHGRRNITAALLEK